MAVSLLFNLLELAPLLSYPLLALIEKVPLTIHGTTSDRRFGKVRKTIQIQALERKRFSEGSLFSVGCRSEKKI
jgi:hypothetical protein